MVYREDFSETDALFISYHQIPERAHSLFDVFDLNFYLISFEQYEKLY